MEPFGSFRNLGRPRVCVVLPRAIGHAGRARVARTHAHTQAGTQTHTVTHTVTHTDTDTDTDTHRHTDRHIPLFACMCAM